MLSLIYVDLLGYKSKSSLGFLQRKIKVTLNGYHIVHLDCK